MFIPQSIFFASAAIQGKFRLKRNKPKQEQEVPSSQSNTQSETNQSDLTKDENKEELPDLDDPDVQKATMKIQVQENVGQGHLSTR